MKTRRSFKNDFKREVERTRTERDIPEDNARHPFGATDTKCRGVRIVLGKCPREMLDHRDQDPCRD